MAKSVEFFFDYGSPYSYLAWTQLPGLARRTGAEVVYRPMLLGGLFKATGNSSPMSVPAKGAYMIVDLQRYASQLNVPMVVNDAFPINTIPLMRGAVAAQEDGTLDTLSKAVFDGIWVNNRNMGDPGIVGEVLGAAGIDVKRLLGRIGEQSVKDTLKATTDEAASRGAFGAPTFFVGEEMFWGHDRMAQVEQALA